MTRWTEMSKVAQWITSVVGAIVVIGGALVTAHGYFETAAAAEQTHAGLRQDLVQYAQVNNEQIALFRIQSIEAQIAEYRYQLLSARLTDAQREWILTEIRRLETDIACIREGTC